MLGQCLDIVLTQLSMSELKNLLSNDSLTFCQKFFFLSLLHVEASVLSSVKIIQFYIIYCLLNQEPHVYFISLALIDGCEGGITLIIST